MDSAFNMVVISRHDKKGANEIETGAGISVRLEIQPDLFQPVVPTRLITRLH